MNDQLMFYKAKLDYEIDSWDLNDSLTRGEDIKVIDARSNEAYQAERIPNSINLPHRSMSAESTSDLDKNTLYVTYCDGIGCNASTKGAYNMAKLGFKVKELMGGLDWWKRDGYQTSGINSSAGTTISCGCSS
jgi:rhodanese-related sulfurtransferase